MRATVLFRGVFGGHEPADASVVLQVFEADVSSLSYGHGRPSHRGSVIGYAR